MTDWNNIETWHRLVASMIAVEPKISVKDVALFFGASYYTIENRFRKLRNDARVLKEEVDSGKRGEVVGPARPRIASTLPATVRMPDVMINNRVRPSNPTKRVAAGRVTKSSPNNKKFKSMLEKVLEEDEDMPDHERQENEKKAKAIFNKNVPFPAYDVALSTEKDAA